MAAIGSSTQQGGSGTAEGQAKANAIRAAYKEARSKGASGVSQTTSSGTTFVTPKGDIVSSTARSNADAINIGLEQGFNESQSTQISQQVAAKQALESQLRARTEASNVNRTTQAAGKAQLEKQFTPSKYPNGPTSYDRQNDPRGAAKYDKELEMEQRRIAPTMLAIASKKLLTDEQKMEQRAPKLGFFPSAYASDDGLTPPPVKDATGEKASGSFDFKSPFAENKYPIQLNNDAPLISQSIKDTISGFGFGLVHGSSGDMTIQEAGKFINEQKDIASGKNYPDVKLGFAPSSPFGEMKFPGQESKAAKPLPVADYLKKTEEFGREIRTRSQDFNTKSQEQTTAVTEFKTYLDKRTVELGADPSETEYNQYVTDVQSAKSTLEKKGVTVTQDKENINFNSKYFGPNLSLVSKAKEQLPEQRLGIVLAQGAVYTGEATAIGVALSPLAPGASGALNYVVSSVPGLAPYSSSILTFGGRALTADIIGNFAYNEYATGKVIKGETPISPIPIYGTQGIQKAGIGLYQAATGDRYAQEGAFFGTGTAVGFIEGFSGGEFHKKFINIENIQTPVGDKTLVLDREITIGGRSVAGYSPTTSKFHLGTADFSSMKGKVFLQTDPAKPGFAPRTKAEFEVAKSLSKSGKLGVDQGLYEDVPEIARNALKVRMDNPTQLDATKLDKAQFMTEAEKVSYTKDIKKFAYDTGGPGQGTGIVEKTKQYVKGLYSAATNTGVDQIYGSASQQAEGGFKYNPQRTTGKFGDYDINFRDTAAPKAKLVYENLVKASGRAGSYRYTEGTGMVEIKTGPKTYAHIADFHGTDLPDLQLTGTPFGMTYQNTKTGFLDGQKVQKSTLPNEILNKASSTLELRQTKSGNIYVEPMAHRTKDPYDLISNAKVLNDYSYNPKQAELIARTEAGLKVSMGIDTSVAVPTNTLIYSSPSYQTSIRIPLPLLNEIVKQPSPSKVTGYSVRVTQPRLEQPSMKVGDTKINVDMKSPSLSRNTNVDIITPSHSYNQRQSNVQSYKPSKFRSPSPSPSQSPSPSFSASPSKSLSRSPSPSQSPSLSPSLYQYPSLYPSQSRSPSPSNSYVNENYFNLFPPPFPRAGGIDQTYQKREARPRQYKYTANARALIQNVKSAKTPKGFAGSNIYTGEEFRPIIVGKKRGGFVI